MSYQYIDSTPVYNNTIVKNTQKVYHQQTGQPLFGLAHTNIIPQAFHGKVWRFNANVPLSELKNHYLFRYLMKLASSKTLTPDEKRVIEEASFSHDYPKYMGWAFDFRDYMRLFWVKTEHNGIQEVRAFSKGGARKLISSFGKIYKIVEIED